MSSCRQLDIFFPDFNKIWKFLTDFREVSNV